MQFIGLAFVFYLFKTCLLLFFLIPYSLHRCRYPRSWIYEVHYRRGKIAENVLTFALAMVNRVFHFCTFFEFLVRIFYFMQKCHKTVGEKNSGHLEVIWPMGKKMIFWRFPDPGSKRGVNHFNIKRTRFLIFQRDFWL